MSSHVYDQHALTVIRSVFDDIQYQNEHAESVCAEAPSVTAAALTQAVLAAAEDGFSDVAQLKARTFDRLAALRDGILVPTPRPPAARLPMALAQWLDIPNAIIIGRRAGAATGHSLD